MSCRIKLAIFLREQGLGTSHIVRHEDRTVYLYLIQLEKGERSFAYWRGESAARMMLEDPAYLANALKSTDTAYFSGNNPGDFVYRGPRGAF